MFSGVNRQNTEALISTQRLSSVTTLWRCSPWKPINKLENLQGECFKCGQTLRPLLTNGPKWLPLNKARFLTNGKKEKRKKETHPPPPMCLLPPPICTPTPQKKKKKEKIAALPKSFKNHSKEPFSDNSGSLKGYHCKGKLSYFNDIRICLIETKVYVSQDFSLVNHNCREMAPHS